MLRYVIGFAIALPAVAAFAWLALVLWARASTSVAVGGDKPAACGDSPNCVSSIDPRERFSVAPLAWKGTAEETRAELRRVLAAIPNTKLIAEHEHYMHFECRTKLIGFVDDLEFLLDAETQEVHIRSASRLGRADFGVNRRRVETIRSRWAAAEATHPPNAE